MKIYNLLIIDKLNNSDKQLFGGSYSTHEKVKDAVKTYLKDKGYSENETLTILNWYRNDFDYKIIPCELDNTNDKVVFQENN